MTTTTTDIHTPAADELREAAVQRLKKRQDFHANLLVSIHEIGLLWTIWALTGRRLPVAADRDGRAGAAG